MRYLLTIFALALCPLATAVAEKQYGGETISQWRTRLADFDAAGPDAAQAVPALVTIVQDEEVDAVTRRAAALALGRIGRPARSALPTLIAMVEASPRNTAEESAWAAKAISLYGPHGREAAPALAKAVVDRRRDLAVRQLSLEALARIGGAHPEAIPAIIAVVQLAPQTDDDLGQNAELRQLAVEALGVAGAEAEVAAPLLARILQSPRESERLRLRSAESLAKMGAGSRFALDTLVETLIIDESEAVRDAAAHAIAQMGPVGRPVLQQLLRHDNAGVRWRAAQSLGAMGEAGAPAVNDLRARARDNREAEIVRLHAIAALWKIEANAESVWLTAVSLLSSDDRNVRKQALDLLVSLGPQARLAESHLRTLTKHERREVRQVAEQALRKIAESN